MTLPNVYLRNPPTGDAASVLQDSFPQLAADREAMLGHVEDILLKFAASSNIRAQLKDILIRQLSSFQHVDVLIKKRGDILLPILHQERDKIRAGNAVDAHTSVIFGSIASTILRMRSAELAEVFLRSDPDVFPEFFAGASSADNSRILKWFAHFQFDGPPKLGSLALEHFGFAHREWFWDQHFRWLAARAPTPIVAANQRHLMLQLDVVGSVRSMLGKFSHEPLHRFPQHEDGAMFWTSSQWKECVRNEMKQLFAIDTQFWIDRMVKFLVASPEEASRNGRDSISRAYWNLVDDFLNEQPPSIQMRSLFSGLTDDKFFEALRSVASQLLSNRGSGLQTPSLFVPFLECLKGFLLNNRTLDKTSHLLIYVSLFDFSSEFIRMLNSDDALPHIRQTYVDYLAILQLTAQNCNVSVSDLDEISHNLLMSRSGKFSLWQSRCLEALLVQIHVSHAVESGAMDKLRAEELFVREGVSCEIVEITRLKRSKKDKRKDKKSRDKKKDKEVVQNTEFLGWRLQSRSAKRVKSERDGEVLVVEPGEIIEEHPNGSEEDASAILHTLSDLHQWFHDAYLRQYLVRNVDGSK